jgi:spore coat polysaccharide biosynthesis protein SpsF
MAETGGAVLAGAADEMLSLARRKGCAVKCVVDPLLKEREWRGLPAFCSDREALEAMQPDSVILAIDDPVIRRRVDIFYQEHRVSAVTLTDGAIDPSATLGEGTVVQLGGGVTTHCRLGRAVRVNMAALVMHDAKIGDYATIAPRAVVLGRATIGAGAYIGANSTILSDRTVGAGAIVGAGAVVTRDVADATVVAGVPARVLRKDHRWLKETCGPVACVVQARMGSQRLPGKVMLPLAGAPMLQRLLERLKPAGSIDRLVVATSTNAENDPIEALCKTLGVNCLRGDEDNVMSRFLAVGEQTGAKTFVRLTGDNPFVDASLIDHLVEAFAAATPRADYVNNIDEDGFPYGLYAEIFSADALDRASKDTSPENREHVTWALRKGDFRTATVRAPGRFRYRRLTVDTPEDFAFAGQAFEREYRRNPAFGFRDLIEENGPGGAAA